MGTVPSNLRSVKSSAKRVAVLIQAGDIPAAREEWLKIRDVYDQYKQLLEQVIQIVVQANAALSAILEFIAALPEDHWVLEGWCILHRKSHAAELAIKAKAADPADKKKAKADAPVTPRAVESAPAAESRATLPMAFFLASLMQRLEGDSLEVARKLWQDSFTPTVRAIAVGKPVVLATVEHNFVLCAEEAAADAASTSTSPQRQVSLRPQDGDKLSDIVDATEEWRIRQVEATQECDRFLLQSIAFDDAFVIVNANKHIALSTPTSDATIGEEAFWQIVMLDAGKEDTLALFHPRSSMYLCLDMEDYELCLQSNARRSFDWRAVEAKEPILVPIKCPPPDPMDIWYRSRSSSAAEAAVPAPPSSMSSLLLAPLLATSSVARYVIPHMNMPVLGVMNTLFQICQNMLTQQQKSCERVLHRLRDLIDEVALLERLGRRPSNEWMFLLGDLLSRVQSFMQLVQATSTLSRFVGGSDEEAQIRVFHDEIDRMLQALVVADWPVLASSNVPPRSAPGHASLHKAPALLPACTPIARTRGICS